MIVKANESCYIGIFLDYGVIVENTHFLKTDLQMWKCNTHDVKVFHYMLVYHNELCLF